MRKAFASSSITLFIIGFVVLAAWSFIPNSSERELFAYASKTENIVSVSNQGNSLHGTTGNNKILYLFELKDGRKIVAVSNNYCSKDASQKRVFRKMTDETFYKYYTVTCNY